MPLEKTVEPTCTTPKVTVCITTFNHAAYVRQTLDSVLMQQTSFPFEILVGDDCSTDGTIDILKAYRDTHPDIVRLNLHEQNVGVNRQDYELIHLAKGEYIAQLDGDDYWITPDKLEKEAHILDTHKECSCVHTEWRDFIEADNRYRDVHLHPKDWERTLMGGALVKKLLTGETCGARFSSTMYRRMILLDFLRDDPSVYLTVPHLQNDFAALCILALSGPFYCLHEITTVYRIRPESLSMTQQAAKRLRYTLSALHQTVYWLKKINASHAFIQTMMRKPVGGILTMMYQQNCSPDVAQEIERLCSDVGYRPSVGQRLLLASTRSRLLHAALKPLVK